MRFPEQTSNRKKGEAEPKPQKTVTINVVDQENGRESKLTVKQSDKTSKNKNKDKPRKRWRLKVKRMEYF